MKILIVFLICVSITACRSPRLTPEGREVLTVDSLSSLTTDCTRLGSVVGQHRLGYEQALTVVKNKAAQQYKADTVVISSVEGHTISRRITGMAFNCADRRTQPVEVLRHTAENTEDVFDKAKKCQTKGGVWVNDQCVIRLD